MLCSIDILKQYKQPGRYFFNFSGTPKKRSLHPSLMRQRDRWYNASFTNNYRQYLLRDSKVPLKHLSYSEMTCDCCFSQ